jgi:hypothetical protein
MVKLTARCRILQPSTAFFGFLEGGSKEEGRKYQRKVGPKELKTIDILQFVHNLLRTRMSEFSVGIEEALSMARC